MNILITGAAGFVGKNLSAALHCLQNGTDRTRPGLSIGQIFLYDKDSPASLLEEACQKADFFRRPGKTAYFRATPATKTLTAAVSSFCVP